MRLDIPNSEKSYLGKIYAEVADLSSSFQFLTTKHTKDGNYTWVGQDVDESEKVYQHSISFMPRSFNNPYASECHIGFIGEFTHVRDFLAMEAMFAEFTEVQRLFSPASTPGLNHLRSKSAGKSTPIGCMSAPADLIPSCAPMMVNLRHLGQCLATCLPILSKYI